jgi:hypothetical protein
MLFMPGLTFPLISTHLYSNVPQKNVVSSIIHCILSALIYYGAVWLFSAQRYIHIAPAIAALLGSLLYFVITIVLLGLRIATKRVIITVLISGIAFVPWLLFTDFVWLGVAIFTWTVINGYTLCVPKTTANIAFVK